MGARRLPFAAVQRLEPEGKRGFAVASSQVTKVKANMADAAYVVDRGRTATWHFALAYVTAAAVTPLLHRYLAASQLPYAERASSLQARPNLPRVALHTGLKEDVLEAVERTGVPQI